MGRGRRGQGGVTTRPEAPRWGDLAAARYAFSFSDELVAQEITAKLGRAVSPAAVEAYLARRPDVVRRAKPSVLPFAYDDVSAELTVARAGALELEEARRREAGESDAELADWLADERARLSHVEHLCYSHDPLFNDRAVVAAMIRRLKKWHRATGRPVAGEGFEDLLAAVWSDTGFKVLLSPRNYDGADAHVALQNDWVAMSMKSEHRAKPSKRTIQLTSLAPHHLDVRTAGDCCAALADAVEHLKRYDRIVYLRSTEETFPSRPEDPAHRYTLLELPHADIIERLRAVKPRQFAKLFRDGGESRNSFPLALADENGEHVFTVVVSRRPPRVVINALEFRYCDLLASYWTEPVTQPRLSAIEALEAERAPAFDRFIV